MMKDENRNRYTIVRLFAVTLICIALGGCDAETKREWEVVMSEAKGQVSNIRSEDDSRLVNGELDYGVTLRFTVKNHGKAGIIKIMTSLSCSEGEWTRTQNLRFDADESQHLNYFFHEPTINAGNVQCGVKISPGFKN